MLTTHLLFKTHSANAVLVQGQTWKGHSFPAAERGNRIHDLDLAFCQGGLSKDGVMGVEDPTDGLV